MHFPSHGRRVEIGKSMKPEGTPRYVLASGTQVREEDFGLLFYTMKGPRLYFLSSGPLLGCSFFQGELTLDQWIRLKKEEGSVTEERIGGIKKSLAQLKDKGVSKGGRWFQTDLNIFLYLWQLMKNC